MINQQPPEHYFTVIGTKGTVKYLADGAREFTAPAESLASTGMGIKAGGKWEEYPSMRLGTQCHVPRQMKHFVAVAAKRSRLYVGDGARVMKLILQCINLKHRAVD